MAGGIAVQSYARPIQVDPRSPAALQKRAGELPDLPSHPLPHRIGYLEEERARLLSEISRLPQHAPRTLSDHLGYHSLPWNDLGKARQDRVIEVQFAFDPGLGAIALAPALVPGKSDGYAFPRRFKIEVLDRGGKWIGGKDGKWVLPQPPYPWVKVVNWMNEDFPDPGPYPVFFNIQEQVQVNRLRMTVPVGEEDSAFHALGELYLFRNPENRDTLGDNMMAWDTISVHATNALIKPPLWDVSCLNDGIVGLGMPLSEELSDVNDFMVSWSSDDPAGESVQIELDLGKVLPIGRTQLWPARAPHDMAISHFGFPGRVEVEISVHPDFRDALRFEMKNIRDRLYTDNVLNIITGAKKARYIRITMGDLDQYMGKKILGLGEIRVSEFDEVWSLNCDITGTGIPPAGRKQLSLLVDGYSRSRRILREVEWIRGLALRRPLDRRLLMVEEELLKAREAWGKRKLQMGIWGGLLTCFALLTAMGLQRLQRRKVLKSLRHRITRDLHDEVGSSLGSINLAARRMENRGATKQELAELSLMAREASASLKDVVWVIDQSRIHLPELLSKLAERAGRVLSGTDLEVELPENCPDYVVPLTFKRHLLMFFKEAVHNCALHSEATCVRFSISIGEEMMVLSLEDNGCGFNPDTLTDGWGLDSMHKRVNELGGKMDLTTAPGSGTKITASLPLRVLTDLSDHSYRTSN